MTHFGSYYDTNIFVYCFDPSEPEKLSISNDIVNGALSDGLGTISFQVVQEFLNVALQKFEVPLTIGDSQVYIDSVLNPLCRLFPDMQLHKAACSVKQTTGLSFFDSLIFAAAMRLECGVLYSEDFQHGFRFNGVEVRNPFV